LAAVIALQRPFTGKETKELRTCLLSYCSDYRFLNSYLVRVRAVQALIRPLKDFSLDALLALGNSAQSIDQICHPAVLRSFQLFLDGAEKGSFKKSRIGQFDQPFWTTALDSSVEISQICVKERFMMEDGKEFIFGAADQLKELGGEIRNMAWAHCFTVMVYEYVNRVLASKPEGWQPKQAVPQVRFVWSALAIEQGAGANNVFMLEERISGGEFVKLIHNGSARLRRLGLPEDEKVVALFLAFSQHVQFSKTSEMAFISDYQGMCIFVLPHTLVSNYGFVGGRCENNPNVFLLTDPQIMTAPCVISTLIMKIAHS
jgi:hypothetical protein